MKEAGRISFVERKADATVRGRVVGDTAETMHEDVPVDLHAPRHRGIVIAAATVHDCAVGSGAKITCRGASIPTRTDARLEHEAITLPASKLLPGEADFHPLGRDREHESTKRPAHAKAPVFNWLGYGGSGLCQSIGADQFRPVGELPQGTGSESEIVDLKNFALVVPQHRPTQGRGCLVHSDEKPRGLSGEDDGLDRFRSEWAQGGHESQEAWEE